MITAYKEQGIMAKSKIKATFQSDTETVWSAVTSLYGYHWRSDIERIEVAKPGVRLIEHTKSGIATEFTITEIVPYKRYAFYMENANICGHWLGAFCNTPKGTEIDFTEDITAKNIFMKPFVKLYLKKQQTTYIRDLRCSLGEG
jgi:hypothetical protein